MMQQTIALYRWFFFVIFFHFERREIFNYYNLRCNMKWKTKNRVRTCPALLFAHERDCLP